MSKKAGGDGPLPDALALHALVWDDNLQGLQAALLLPSPPLEALDAHGNTPLLLAYRMGRTRAAKMLLAAGAFSKVRAPGGWEGIQVAALTGNPELARTAVTAFLAETDAAFERRLPLLHERLAAMPDFTMRLSWTFESWIPLVSRLLPSDSYSIYKRGSTLRLDTTLLGMSGLTWERGSISLLLWGQGMPTPGACYVTDNEAKTAADARLAFTRPRDVHIQDWVRKLLTQKQKATDWWSRDVQMAPIHKAGLVGGFFARAKALVGVRGGAASQRGRLSEGVAVEDKGEGAEGAAAAAEPTPLVHDPHDAQQVYADVGGWGPCAAYALTNLCIRDTTFAPVRPKGLRLDEWWLPEYSMETTVEKEEARAAAAAAAAASAAAARGNTVAEAEAPEELLKPLFRALSAIRTGHIKDASAASKATTLEELEQLGGAEGAMEGGAGGAGCGSAMTAVAFEVYFGADRPLASDAEKAAAAAALAAAAASSGAVKAASGEDDVDAQEKGSSSGSGGGACAMPQLPYVPYIASDGRLHRPVCNVASVSGAGESSVDKEFDLKVYFAKDFPITVAEVMARTSSHAENFTRFFNSKMPRGAGFPVRFTIPVFPTVTATVTFELCDTRRSPPASYFELRPDYVMGAYVEKGFIRQL